MNIQMIGHFGQDKVGKPVGSTISAGTGQSQVYLNWSLLGEDLVVAVFNKNAHVGAVALADVHAETNRCFASVLCSPGHREDALAHELALRISKRLKRRICLMAGIHMENATTDEIEAAVEAAREAADLFIETIAIKFCAATY